MVTSLVHLLHVFCNLQIKRYKDLVPTILITNIADQLIFLNRTLAAATRSFFALPDVFLLTSAQC